ncbi:unnamed protein product, partial [Gongylonema pulchrum]
MFMVTRLSHVAHVWPDTYEKLTISDNIFFRNQIISVRRLYAPVAIAIGLMILFPKLILLLRIFFAKVSFWRAATADMLIGLVTMFYTSIT